jgi:hypothetical protein
MTASQALSPPYRLTKLTGDLRNKELLQRVVDFLDTKYPPSNAAPLWRAAGMGQASHPSSEICSQEIKRNLFPTVVQ